MSRSGSSGRGETPGRSDPASGGGQKTWRWLALIALLLPAAAVLLPTTVVLAVMMLPTVAAVLVDRLDGRPLAYSVGMLNFAGALPALIQVWNHGHDGAATEWVLSNAVMWLSAYLAASGGWLLFAILPPILRSIYARTTHRRIKALQRQQEQLEDTWGPEVARSGRGQNEPEAEAAAA